MLNSETWSKQLESMQQQILQSHEKNAIALSSAEDNWLSEKQRLLQKADIHR